MREIHGTVMHYPWGTTDAIPDLLGIPADGRPYAEYWLGAHPVSPSVMGGRRLDAALAEEPELLGDTCVAAFGGRLPFMMKVLSARHALSIQAHPDRDRAVDGFVREEADGIPLDDPLRSYKDDWPKSEMLIALTPFELLLGFRTPERTLELIRGLDAGEAVEQVLAPLAFRRGTAGTEEVFLEVLTLTGDRLEIVHQLLVAAVRHADDPDEVGDLARLLIELDASFPGDPGIVAAALMNHVRLDPGEAVFIPAGTMHADLRGTGIEVLVNSDNVVRGGLTTKHIAVNELVAVVDFGALEPAILHGQPRTPGVWEYPFECAEFAVWRMEVEPGQELEFPADGSVRISLVTRGAVSLTDAGGRLDLERGQAMFLPAFNSAVRMTGDGQLFLAAPGLR